MKVYLVSRGEYSGWELVAIFSSYKRAISYMGGAENCSESVDYGERWNDIEEFEVDSPKHSGKTHVRQWERAIFLDDGSSDTCFDGCELVEIDDSGNYETPPPEVFEYQGRKMVKAYSSICQEHADKLAAEARQAWLRNESLGLK